MNISLNLKQKKRKRKNNAYVLRSIYRNTICNRIRGASEGTIFPPNLDKRAVFRVYRKAFCRTLPIIFKEEVVTEDGIPSYLYIMSEDFLDPPNKNPDNECYCRKLKKCHRKGLSDLTTCYFSKSSY